MQRPGSSVGRLKKQQQDVAINNKLKKQQDKTPSKEEKEEFIKNRDFVGAITLLEHEKM